MKNEWRYVVWNIDEDKRDKPVALSMKIMLYLDVEKMSKINRVKISHGRAKVCRKYFELYTNIETLA